MNSKIIIAIVVVLLILGGGAFFLSQNKSGTPTPTPQVTQTQEEPSATTTPQVMGEESTPSGAMTQGETKEFTVTSSNFKFAPATLTVKKGDTVKIIFKNSGGFHDFVIDEFNVKTNTIQGGASETVEFVADKAGTFDYYCSVGNHRQMGMQGTLTVQ